VLLTSCIDPYHVYDAMVVYERLSTSIGEFEIVKRDDRDSKWERELCILHDSGMDDLARVCPTLKFWCFWILLML
jgi:hypothetical protein